ncbi:hypothetical protein T4D_8499 [Trichinella pseudospiralis]|uniref:Uncharacterized protein n=1 Tax=Trichinella pseudospiralis TaxID=6337 RepID=A0A0V1E6I4_TRIPS|nr:hypothetical protein T4D_8499 [Trichinella pseudospiralis]
MLTHSEDDSFLQISQEIGDKERCEYFHCIWQIVPNRLISILSTFEKKGVSRKFRIFVVFLENFEISSPRSFFIIFRVVLNYEPQE